MHHSSSFTIGICASGKADKLPHILDLIRKEYNHTSPDCELRKIVVVASGCSPEVISFLNHFATEDTRLNLIIESNRHGKAKAINKILELSQGEFIVLLNSDAIPERGSIAKLIEIAKSDSKVGTVSAAPVFKPLGGTISKVLELMWSAHNTSALMLNHVSLSNHASDELMLVRNGLVAKIPEDTVNDGAYIGGIVYTKGYGVRFSKEALVWIDVPKKGFHLIQQRRRIIFGHLRVWSKVGLPPRTIKSLLIIKPKVGFNILINLFSRKPVLIFYAPFAIVLELIATVLALLDRLTSNDRHRIWRRYSNS